MKQRRVSKLEWLEEALKVLEREGIEAVRIGRLARDLGTSRSGFYWHFRDRAELHEAMLDYWEHEFTGVVTGNKEMAEGPPKERLRKVMEMILEFGFTRYDPAIRGWAAMDPSVAKRLRKVYKQREHFVRNLFAEMGFEGPDLEMRTRLFICYHSWEVPMFSTHSKKSLRELIPLRLELLTRK